MTGGAKARVVPGSCEATTPNFPDLSTPHPPGLKGTWKDTRHTLNFMGAASCLLPSLNTCSVLYAEAEEARAALSGVWISVLETPVWEGWLEGRGWRQQRRRMACRWRGGAWAAEDR